METLDSNPIPSSSSSSSSSSTTFGPADFNLQNPSVRSPPPVSFTRLWRPYARKNLINQWSRLASYRQQWASLSSSGRSHATSLVNAHLSQRYMHAMDLGVLGDMPNIREKAVQKLFRKQEINRRSLLSSYKDMVAVVTHMVNTGGSMRCFLKGTNSSLVNFATASDDKTDLGDCGGIPAFTFWSISSFERLAQELVEMFVLELNLKRLLVIQLLAVSCEAVPQVNRLCWSNELYPGEFDDLCTCNLYSKETGELVPPVIRDCNSSKPPMQSKQQPDQEVLQVYLTTWLAEVNIDTDRVDEIFAVTGEEMRHSIR